MSSPVHNITLMKFVEFLSALLLFPQLCLVYWWRPHRKELADGCRLVLHLEVFKILVWLINILLQRRSQFWLHGGKCFFDLLFIAFVISIHNGLLKSTLPLCLTVKVPLFRTWSTYRWQKGRNEHLLCLRLAILGDVCKINDLFTLLPHLPHLWSIKETGFQTPVGWLFWVARLPVFSVSCFRNKVIFLASVPHLLDSLACHAVSRVSLDSVALWETFKSLAGFSLLCNNLIVYIWLALSPTVFPEVNTPGDLGRHCKALKFSSINVLCTSPLRGV